MSPTDPPTQPPDELGALARELDRLTRRVEEMAPAAQRVGELDTAVEKLGNLIADVMDRLRGEQTEARAWLLQVGTSEPQQAIETLTDLVQWLDAVYLRYPGSELPGCWMWHPWVVEELLWLRTSHAEAYAGRGWGVRAGMWHDQQRPRVVDRIRQHAGSCDLGQHVSGGQKAKGPVAAPLGGHAHAVATAWTSTGLPPEPASEQIEDARAYDDLQLRRP
jgi:hypothetical protein